jgi:hypothetical protein
MSIRIVLRNAVLAQLLLGAVASAQWRAGAKVGFGQTGFTGSSEFIWKTGPRSSAFVGVGLAPHLEAQIEAAAVRVVGVSDVAGAMITLTTDYLTFPVFMKLQVPTLGSLVPYTFAGPIFAIRLRCSLETVVGNIESSDDCNAGGQPSSSPVTTGLGAGIGVERQLGITTLLVETRASTGLTVESVPVDASRPRRFGWSVLGGVSLPLSRMPTEPRASPTPTTVQSTPPSTNPPVAQATPPASAAAAAQPLPQLPVQSVVTVPVQPVRPRDALDALPATRLVTVNAVDADVRSLLLLIARQAGVSIVVDPSVSGRVWVSLTDVPVADAMRAVLESAHLTVRSDATSATQAAVVFYQLPINVNTATAPVIANRFGVSDALANFVVESRPKPASSP